MRAILFTFVALLATGIFNNADAQYLKRREIYKADPDTLVSTTADVINVGLVRSGGQYPKFVAMVLDVAEAINNAERITLNVKQGSADIYETEATLDTLIAASTAGSGAVRYFDTQALSGVGTKLKFTFAQLASAAATDSIGYSVRIFGVYQTMTP